MSEEKYYVPQDLPPQNLSEEIAAQAWEKVSGLSYSDLFAHDRKFQADLAREVMTILCTSVPDEILNRHLKTPDGKKRFMELFTGVLKSVRDKQ